MKTSLQTAKRQQGAALIVGLVMMMVLTVLAVSTMNSSTMELTMATNNQERNNAFQAAESTIDVAIARRDWNTTTPTPTGTLSFGGYGTGTGSTACQTTTFVPDRSFSMGVGTGGVEAFHFDITAQGNSTRNAISFHTQSFYVVGPGGSGGC